MCFTLPCISFASIPPGPLLYMGPGQYAGPENTPFEKPLRAKSIPAGNQGGWVAGGRFNPAGVPNRGMEAGARIQSVR